MAEPLNDVCFTQPHWLVIARGFDVESWFEEGQVVGTGGISMPKETDLAVGQRYYRFASSTSSRASQVGGGWWIEYEAFKTIEQFANRHRYSLSEAARLFLALPYIWTRVDRLVSAILEVPLRAYSGHGKPAQGSTASKRTDGTWIPMQHQPVRQLYIPGLYVAGSRPKTQLYEQAFPEPKFEFILGRRRAV
jgi:hypothetical protein